MARILRTEPVAIDSVQPHPGNARIADTAPIAESLRINGQYRPIVVQASTGFILAGNHTWKAAKSIAWEVIETTFVECDDREATRILLVDNRTADLGHYDDGLLVSLLSELDGELAGSGYDDMALAALLRDPSGMPESGKGLGEMVVSYQIVFDDEDQQRVFYRLIAWLKAAYPEAETIGGRFARFALDTVQEGT
jgi:hypothetical protein